jgi:hypothetical protein
MTYCLLRQDARLDQWKARFVDGVPLDALRAGLPIDEPTERIRVTLSAWGREPSDLLELPAGVAVSPAMRDALDRAGVDNVQYIKADVRMEYVADVVVRDYWVANVVGVLACVDPDFVPSELGVKGRGLRQGFRVDPLRAGGFSMFRLAEDRRLVVIGDGVAQALRAAGLRGLVLQDTERYTGSPVSTAPPEPAETSSDNEYPFRADLGRPVTGPRTPTAP